VPVEEVERSGDDSHRPEPPGGPAPELRKHFLQSSRFWFPVGVEPVNERGFRPGKSLWRVWNLPAKTGWLREDAELPVAGAPQAHEVVPGGAFELLERVPKRLSEHGRSRVPVVLGTALGLGDDPVDHP
jgi:hypothetical protein